MSLHTDNKAVTVLVQKQHQILLWNIQVQLTLQLIRGMFPSFVTKMDEVFRMQMSLHTDNKAVTVLVPKQTTKLICETFRYNWLCSWSEGCFPLLWPKWMKFSECKCLYTQTIKPLLYWFQNKPPNSSVKHSGTTDFAVDQRDVSLFCDQNGWSFQNANVSTHRQ